MGTQGKPKIIWNKNIRKTYDRILTEKSTPELYKDFVHFHFLKNTASLADSPLYAHT